MPPRISPAKVRQTLPFVVLGIAVLFYPIQPDTTTPTNHKFEVDARQYQYTPGRIQVNQGDRVEISFTSSDVVHGFYLESYDLELRAVPGVAQTLSFVADQPGKFHFRCSVSCGPLHPFMTGELVVHANAPFWRAIGLSFIALAGAVYFHFYKQQEAP